MTKLAKVMGAAAILVGAGLGTGAMADASAMTCGEFAKMDDAGRLQYAHELLLWISDTANFEAAGPAITGRYGAGVANSGAGMSDVLAADNEAGKGWTHQQMKIEIEAHCIKMPGDANVLQQLKDHT